MADDEIRVTDPYRQWALDNVRKAGRPNIPKCSCWKYSECVLCAYWLGYAEGQVAAGAFITNDELFLALRARYGPDPEKVNG